MRYAESQVIYEAAIEIQREADPAATAHLADGLADLIQPGFGPSVTISNVGKSGLTTPVRRERESLREG